MARILLVEDDALVRHGISRMLVAAGHELRVASRGAAGVDEAALFDPQLVVLDVGLPDFDGIECARRLRAARYAGPIVFLTADGSPDTVRAAIGLGAHSYMVKPITGTQLLPVVLTALAAADAAHERERRMQTALDDSRRISAAVGVLAERHGTSTTAAFELLRGRARGRSQKVSAAAEEVLSRVEQAPGETPG
ncbi:MAG: response regulator [Burkholderiales bacterium]|nr:response regulator [Burkholderiales bacterium]